MTGSHEASVAAVAEGQAGLASIDCVSFALLRRGRPELLERVAIVDETPLSPCLPFIASARLPSPTIEAVRKALLAALADPDLAETRAALGLVGARIVAPADYDRVMVIEREAAAMVTRVSPESGAFRLHASKLARDGPEASPPPGGGGSRRGSRCLA